MGNIVIPKELPDLIDRIYYLRDECKNLKNRDQNQERRALLTTLRTFKAPTELEKSLMKELESMPQVDTSSLEKQYKDEEYGLYEKIREVCRDMLLGKYVEHFTAHTTVYMRVTKVSMSQGGGGCVSISGPSISLYKDTNTLQWACEQQFDLFDCCCVKYGNSSNTAESLATEMRHFYIMPKNDIADMLREYKERVLNECDQFISYAENMKDAIFPEDKPVDASKWW
jgi:hypothetical protein